MCLRREALTKPRNGSTGTECTLLCAENTASCHMVSQILCTTCPGHGNPRAHHVLPLPPVESCLPLGPAERSSSRLHPAPVTPNTRRGRLTPTGKASAALDAKALSKQRPRNGRNPSASFLGVNWKHSAGFWDGGQLEDTKTTRGGVGEDV